MSIVAREQAESLIWKIVDELEERQAEVIVGRYKESVTLEEISKRLNLSYQRIRQIEKKALSVVPTIPNPGISQNQTVQHLLSAVQKCISYTLKFVEPNGSEF